MAEERLYLACKADVVGRAVEFAQHGRLHGWVPHSALTKSIQRFGVWEAKVGTEWGMRRDRNRGEGLWEGWDGRMGKGVTEGEGETGGEGIWGRGEGVSGEKGLGGGGREGKGEGERKGWGGRGIDPKEGWEGRGGEGVGEWRGGESMEEDIIQIPYSYIIKCMHSYLHRKKMCT